MRDICLVVPTIRENCFTDFFKRWNDIGLFNVVDLMIMEDNPHPTFDMVNLPIVGPGFTMHHLSWSVIKEALGSNEWVIPRRSDTVRSFAYYRAWKQGYKYIMTLDDDCYPATESDGLTYSGKGFVDEHLRQITKRSRWFNTLNSVKPRGIPFYNVGTCENVIVNHGLWTNVLDYDAPYQLANPIKENFSFDNRAIPSGMYFPMCGMNVMWRSDVTVLMYHLLMGQMLDVDTGVLTKLPFDRFGDIWCGIFMKKIADSLDLMVTSGMPYIRHERASNPFVNLKKEVNGIEVNEDLWAYVDSVNITSDNVVDAYAELAREIRNFTSTRQFSKYSEYEKYFDLLSRAMLQWSELFGATP